jgi:hypothetical protein
MADAVTGPARTSGAAVAFCDHECANPGSACAAARSGFRTASRFCDHIDFPVIANTPKFLPVATKKRAGFRFP